MYDLQRLLGIKIFENIIKTEGVEFSAIKAGEICLLKIENVNLNIGFPNANVEKSISTAPTQKQFIVSGANGKTIAYQLGGDEKEDGEIEIQKKEVLPFKTGLHYIFSEAESSEVHSEPLMLSDKTMLFQANLQDGKVKFESLDPFDRNLEIAFHRNRPVEIQLEGDDFIKFEKRTANIGRSTFKYEKVKSGQPVSVSAASPTVVTFLDSYCDVVWHLRRIHPNQRTEDYFLVFE